MARPDCSRMSWASPGGTAARIGRPVGEVFVCLAGHGAGAAARGEILHRQEQQVGRTHQGDRVGVRQIPVQDALRRSGSKLTIHTREHTGEMQLQPVSETGITLDQLLHRLEQIDMRAGQDLDARRRPTQQPPQARTSLLLQPELGVQIARMHDPELPRIVRRNRAVREVRRVVAVRDRNDRPIPQLRKRLSNLTRSLRRAHDDRRRRPQQPTHRGNRQPPMNPRRINHHLVQRPRIAQVGDPADAQCARQRGAALRGGVGRHDRVDDVDVGRA